VIATERTNQALLVERAAFVREQRREQDEDARALLQWEIDQLDRVLHGVPKHLPVRSEVER
jgi:hypothetical protein